MTQTITVIYEHGVLRPLSPLALPERAEVQISIHIPPSLPGSVEQRRHLRAVLQAAGTMNDSPTIPQTTLPLSTAERAALADRLAIPGAMTLSETILAEREGR